MEDKALVRINKEGHNVIIRVNSRVDGSLLFECRYKSSHSDRVVYYDARSIVDIFTKSHGLHIDKELTEIDLGYVRNSAKRSR
jgi:hypothetical protein